MAQRERTDEERLRVLGGVGRERVAVHPAAPPEAHEHRAFEDGRLEAALGSAGGEGRIGVSHDDAEQVLVLVAREDRDLERAGKARRDPPGKAAADEPVELGVLLGGVDGRDPACVEAVTKEISRVGVERRAVGRMADPRRRIRLHMKLCLTVSASAGAGRGREPPAGRPGRLVASPEGGDAQAEGHREQPRDDAQGEGLP